MEINAQHFPDKSLITIEKDKLIGVENESLQNLVQDSINQGSKNISVDLSSVKFISSWGIGILVQAYTTCANRNVRFSIQGVNDSVLSVLNQLKLVGLFNIT